MGNGPSEVVLIVNSFDDREMYREYLESKGVLVLMAPTPDEALQLLDSVRPAVIVTDLVFLGNRLDACALISSVRSRSELDYTSIIVVSGYVREQDRQQAHRCGADLFAMKPCLPETLLAHVKRALISRRHGARICGVWTLRALDRRRTPRVRGDRRRHRIAATPVRIETIRSKVKP